MTKLPTITKPPRGTPAKVSEWAATGASMRVCARRLGVSEKVFREWIEHHRAVREAWEEGIAAEHAFLYGRLMKLAADGNPTAAIFLLKARHGYRENAPVESPSRLNIQITLPAAAPKDEWVQARVIEHEPVAPTKVIKHERA